MRKKLAIFANSDVHGPIDFDYQASKYEHRPMTIVFVKERTPEGIREAFFSRRTLACFKDTLLGSEEYLKPLIRECIESQNSYYLVNSKNEMNVILTNLSDFPLNLSGYKHRRLFPA